nr:PTS transporter subunit EIIB [Mycoplasmopsis bovis]
MAKTNKILDTNTEEYKQPKQIIQALGGLENISKYHNCATKLRYDIVNKDLVNETELINSGARELTLLEIIMFKWNLALKQSNWQKILEKLEIVENSKNE